ncbi:MAG: UDP-glucose 4-epimerase (EC [uncultured Sulfurovum sp.]|uniref:UDP-glucose 4-epimerase (EC) n=1 Tax=uncultured Sulfurovum sp. TaxID=269237 RepID=A0A6S6T8R5_9BACT|nr:MAG: UDP-glucose 4-epimerase (EC [uncultured Sulfurovum sp.]
MKIIVTGSTGFVAKSIIDTLVSQGHEIHAIIREHSNTSGINEKAIFYEDNGSTQALVEYFQSIKPDGVLHLASLFLAQHQEDDIDSLILSNITFGTRLLEASVNSDTKWFINTGTFWQHYENQEYSPVNLYAATKQAFQDIAKFYYETKKLNFVTIKLNDTFGPGDTRKKVFNLWKGLAASGENLGMSPGNQVIDISYIEDIVEAYTLMIQALVSDSDFSYAGKAFVVSSSECMSLKKLAKVYENATGKTLDITWGERPYREREVMLPWNKGELVPGWKQNTSLEDAIIKTSQS